MNAILGLAMGTVTGDRGLSVRSGAGLAGGVLVVIATAFIAGSLICVLVFGDEIIGRTHPTLRDLLVAVAAGLAGAYSLVGAGASTVLPGVAIAPAPAPHPRHRDREQRPGGDAVRLKEKRIME